MAITNNVDLVLTFDNDQLVTSPRILGPSVSQTTEHAAQCCAIECLRQILSTGITLAEWNSSENPWMFQGQTWDDWWTSVCDTGHVRATLNVGASEIPRISTEYMDMAANMAQNLFEHGYATIMAATSQGDKVTFTRTGGL